jgi:hypothetical protein
MKMIKSKDSIRIEFDGKDIISTEGDDVRTTAIVFGWEDFDNLVWQYMYGRETDEAEAKLPPRRCDNCRHAGIEKRLDGKVRCSKDSTRELIDGDNGCDDHLYQSGLLD